MAKKYFIDDEEVIESEFESRVDTEIRNEAENTYDDWLDEAYSELRIGRCRFGPSVVLKKCDPIAYRCGLNDYEDNLSADYKPELEIENKLTVNNVEFRIEEDEEDED